MTENKAGNQPWQFGLRTVLLAVAAVGGVCTLWRELGAGVAVCTAWMAAMVVAHMAATARGRQGIASQAADQQPREEAGQRLPARGEPIGSTGEETRLRATARIGWIMMLGAATSAAGGGAVGGWILINAYGHRDARGAVAVGTFAAALIGGYLGFLASSFAETAWRALRQSMRASQGLQAH